MIEICDLAKSFTLHNQNSTVIPVMAGQICRWPLVNVLA